MFVPPFKSNLKDYMFESDINLFEMLSMFERVSDSCMTRVLGGPLLQHSPSIRQWEDYLQSLLKAISLTNPPATTVWLA